MGSCVGHEERFCVWCAGGGYPQGRARMLRGESFAIFELDLFGETLIYCQKKEVGEKLAESKQFVCAWWEDGGYPKECVQAAQLSSTVFKA